MPPEVEAARSPLHPVRPGGRVAGRFRSDPAATPRPPQSEDQAPPATWPHVAQRNSGNDDEAITALDAPRRARAP